MTEHQRVTHVPAGARRIEVSAVVLRAKPCPACEWPNRFNADDCEKCGASLAGAVSAEEDRGVIAFWHKSVLHRLAFRAGRFLARVQGR